MMRVKVAFLSHLQLSQQIMKCGIIIAFAPAIAFALLLPMMARKEGEAMARQCSTKVRKGAACRLWEGNYHHLNWAHGAKAHAGARRHAEQPRA